MLVFRSKLGAEAFTIGTGRLEKLIHDSYLGL